MSIHAFLQRRKENILSCRRAYGLGDSFIIEKKSISLFVYPLTLVGDSLGCMRMCVIVVCPKRKKKEKKWKKTGGKT